MTGHTLGDAPIEAAYYDKMAQIAQGLDMIFNGQVGGPGRKTGFVVLAFPFGNVGGRCNFISNGANRDDLVVLFKEMIARFEGQPEPKPGRA